jgi:ribosomal protein S18 acetylase RimI-like enzyme
VNVFPSFSLRPAGPADEDFLFAVFLSSREFDLALLPEAQRKALMRMQFRGQQMTYTQRYPQGEHHIISVDGSDAGSIWLAETGHAIVIVDIALLPEFRNRGIGKQIYTGMIERAAAAGKPLCATVSAANQGSLRFHERLGFRREGSNGMHISMVIPGIS